MMYFESSECSSTIDQPNLDENTKNLVDLANQFPNIEVPDDEFKDLLNYSHSQELRISLNSKDLFY